MGIACFVQPIPINVSKVRIPNYEVVDLSRGRESNFEPGLRAGDVIRGKSRVELVRR